jgi:hypothetical protein
VKAYRFRLDSVLRVRQLQERVAAQQLAVAVRELQAARAQLARARRALAGLDAPSGRHTIGAAPGHAGVGKRQSAHGGARATGRAPFDAVAGRARPE